MEEVRGVRIANMSKVFVASSYRSTYGVPTLDVSSFVSLMIHVSSYFPSHYFGILYKVESCIAT